MRDLLVLHAPSPARPSHPAPRLARLLLAVLLVGSAAGCMSWRARPTPQPYDGAVRRFEFARVTVDGGERMVLHDVRVTEDSVVGWRKRGVDGGLDEVRLARSQVRDFAVRRFNAVGTGAVIAAALAAIWAGLAYHTLSSAHT